MDHMPVSAIAGQQARAAIGGHYQQELDLKSMFKDVAGAFVAQASTLPQTRRLVARAVRTAVVERMVTALIFPDDLQDLPYEYPPRKHGKVHSGVGLTVPRVPPHITLEQARKFNSVLVQGDPDASHVVADTARQVLSSLVSSD